MTSGEGNDPQGNVHVVLGAGPLGRAVAEALRAQSKRVRIVNRSAQMPSAPEGIELVRADLYDSANVRTVTADACAVYQCAQPEYTRWPQDFPRLMRAHP